MKPKMTPAQARQYKRDLEIKERLVLEMTKKIKDILQVGVDSVYSHYQKTGKYKEPNLDGIFDVANDFYRAVVMAAIQSCKKQVPNKKRLADAPQANLPDGKPALDRVLTNRKFWQRIYVRGRKLFGKQKKEYLDKLKVQFKKVLPLLDSHDLSPRDAKKQIAEAWKAPAARVETIFRTETTTYFSQAQVEYFQDSSQVLGFQFDSVRDTSRTPICKCREGMVMPMGSKVLRDNTPPLHYNCRSHLLPIPNDAEGRAMMKEASLDPANRKLIPPLPGFGGN